MFQNKREEKLTTSIEHILVALFMPYPNDLSKSVLQVVKTFTILLYSRTYTFVWSLFYIILLTGQPILNETTVLYESNYFFHITPFNFKPLYYKNISQVRSFIYKST